MANEFALFKDAEAIYLEGRKRWTYYLISVGIRPERTQRRYVVEFVGRPYFVAFEWIPKDGCGYIYYGTIENFGSPTENDVVKHVFKMTEAGAILVGKDRFTVENEASVKNLHASCIMQMDEEVCEKLPKPS